MATAIACGGATWYTELSIAHTKIAIESGQEIKVWWWAGWGHRFQESIYVPIEKLDFLRTESDDG